MINFLFVNKADLKKALEFTWKGMLSIFIVIGIIIAAVSVLNYINDKSNKKNNIPKDTNLDNGIDDKQNGD